jgi:hypothetical protein
VNALSVKTIAIGHCVQVEGQANVNATAVVSDDAEILFGGL